MKIKFLTVKLSTKIAVIFSLLNALIVLAIYLYVPYKLKEQSMYEVAIQSKSLARMCAYSISPALYFKDELSVAETFEGLRQIEDITYLVVSDDSGKIFSAYNLELAEGAKFRDVSEAYSKSNNLYKYQCPVWHNSAKIGYLYLGMSLDRTEKNIRQSKSHITIASIILFGLALLCVFFISSFITKRLKNLVITFGQISKGDLTRRAKIDTQDELGQLGSSFNIMVDNLEEVYKEIEGVNLMLETNVEERTKELKREIEEHTLTVEKLYRSETRSRALLNAVPDRMFLVNKDAIIIEYKSDSLNTSKEEEKWFVGKSASEILPANLSNEAIDLIRQTMMTGKSHEYETELTINGEVRVFEARYVNSWEDEVLVIVRDITELRRQFKALQSSEAKFRILTETLPIAIFIQVDNKIIYSNPGAEILTGYSRGELNNKLFTDLVDPEYTVFLENFIVEDNMEKTIEIKTIKEDKSFTWAEFTMRDIEYEGKKACLIAIVDITERKKAEEQIRILSRAVEQSSVSVIITDKNANIEYVNPQFSKVTGYSFQEVIGKNPRLLKSGLKTEEEYKNIWRMILSGKDWQGEFLNKKKNGELFWEACTISSVKNMNGEIVHFVGIKQDITEQKHVEEKLIQSERDYRGLFENAHDAIIIFDPKTFTILDANTEACIMYGYLKNNLIGKQLNTFSLEESVDKYLVERASKDFIVKNYETVHKNNNGNEINLEMNAALIYYKGDKAILAIIRDITERKNYEKDILMAKEEAEKSNRLKSEFLAQISHEIRTPMNSILCFSSLLKEELQNIVTDDLKQAFEIIDNGGRRLIRTVDLILNMSQIQTGSYKLIPDNIDICKNLLDQMYLEFSVQAKAKGLDFEMVKTAHNTFLVADLYTLSQIFGNIIDNAIKFTNRGKITIKIYNDNKNNLCVEVQDTGVGISPEYMKNLFTPFSQEESGYTRTFEGNGLGLALVKVYVNLNNAKIFVQSEKDKGSIFTVVFTKDLHEMKKMPSDDGIIKF